jgi:thiamine pyrophosphate-dependent acetolactate synthase large subunit-like protein
VLQELDHVSIMKPITKFAATVPHTQRIPEIISMAFREAYNGRPGPSCLEIPRDVLDAKEDLDKVRFPEKSGWNQIRFGRLSKYGQKRSDVANKPSPTRYDVIVEAMGGYGELVTQPQDIRPAMERARASGKSSCVNVILDPDMYSSGTMNQTMYK